MKRARWDERAPVHAASPDCDLDRFASDAGHLSDTVRFDLPRLGDVAGLRTAHLQCHIDTVSPVRLGAQVVGLDLSAASVAEARRLDGLAGTQVDFVEGDLRPAEPARPRRVRPGPHRDRPAGRPRRWRRGWS